MPMVRVSGDFAIRWEDLLCAIERYTVEVPAGELSHLDAQRLQNAANNVSIRVTELEGKAESRP